MSSASRSFSASSPPTAFSASLAFSSTLPERAKSCCALLNWRAAVRLPSPSLRWVLSLSSAINYLQCLLNLQTGGSDARFLMGEDHRHRGFHDDVPRGAAKDHLPQPALRVGAFDHEVGADRLRLVAIDLAGGAALGDDVAADGGNAMARQVEGEVLGAGTWRHAALDAHHLHARGPLEERHGEGHGARRLGAAVPGDQDTLADAGMRVGRRHQHGTAALEQSILERRLGERGELRRPLHDDEIENAAE